MRSVVCAAALFLAAGSACAGTWGVHVASVHLPRSGMNGFNPGLYYVADSGVTVGAYWNSERRVSAYAGWTLDVPLTGGLVQATAGLVSGYGSSARRVHPMVIPSVRVGHARVMLVPKSPKTVWTLHLAYEF